MYKSKFPILFLLSIICVSYSFASTVKVTQSLSQNAVFAGGSFLVKIHIERNDLDSYFQIAHDLPDGITAVGVESHGATFSFKEGKIKYSWLRLPDMEEIQVIYKVTVPFEMKGKQEITGNYYYIINEERMEFSTTPLNIVVKENVSPSDTLAEKTLLSVVNNDENQPSYVSEVKPDLLFKIQILSSTRKLSRDSIRKEYKIRESVHEENFNGLYKYTVGNFKTYEEARDFKNNLDFKKYIPFVIAYNRGARITIGEAMQIAAKRKTIVKD
jgi:hypothetical protein